MRIKTPRFWYPSHDNGISLLEHVLSPISCLYQKVSALNYASKKTQKIQIPVICIGNITAGGSGKTPTAISLSRIIKKHGIGNAPYFLTRGYGASNKTTRVTSVHEPSHATGDEPQILLKHCKTVISSNRYAGALLAQQDGADLIIMDDGFQNPSLHKDISFLVIDGKTGLGNRKTIPSGPLREPLNSALSRASACIIIGNDIFKLEDEIQEKYELPVFQANLVTTEHHGKNNLYIGFAGLGHPQKFLNTLEGDGYNVKHFAAYPDHYKYSNDELEALIAKAHAENAKLITTEKDFMRIPQKYHDKILYLPVKLEFKDEEKLIHFLQNSLSSLN